MRRLLTGVGERPQGAPDGAGRQRRGLLAAGAGLVLGGCGFKLRQAPNFAFSTLYINAGSALPLAAELRRAIESAGKVTVLTAPGDMARADVVLELLSNPQERAVVAQNSTGQVQEFPLRMSVKFNLHTPTGRLLIPDTELMQQRDVSFNETLALAKMSEESLLLRSMQTELVQLIMIRLAAVREPIERASGYLAAPPCRHIAETMQLPAAQLASHLGKGLRSLYVLHGDEALLVQEAADALRAAARAQGYGERTVHTVAGAHFDWSEVLAGGASMSLFAERQLVEVRMPSGKPGKDGATAIQQLADSAVGNEATLLLFMLPRLDKATRNTPWFGALENAGVSIQIDPAAMDRAAAAATGAAGRTGRGRSAHVAVLRRSRGRQPAGCAPGGAKACAALSGRRTRV